MTENELMKITFDMVMNRPHDDSIMFLAKFMAFSENTFKNNPSCDYYVKYLSLNIEKVLSDNDKAAFQDRIKEAFAYKDQVKPLIIKESNTPLNKFMEQLFLDLNKNRKAAQ